MNHLNAVAEIQKNRILEALDRNEERLEKLTQDTTLHLSLSKYLESNDPLDLKEINSILNYNVDSINDFHAIALFSMDGTKITSIEKNNSEFPASLFFPEGKSKNFITITYDKNPVLFLSGPIIVKDKPIGVIVIESDAVTITSITQDHTGLGKTGETILAKRTLGNDALFVTPLRFDAEADFSKTIPQGKIEIPITQAMLSKEISLIDATDYRGEKVMAVTKHIPHVDWGLVSKIDTSEVYSIRNGTTVFLVGIVIIMSGILTSMSLLLSENILKPVSRLKSHINQLTKGNFKNKIPLEGDNEISSLAETVTHLQISLDKSNHETIIFEKKLQQQLHARNELKRAMDESAGVAITDPDGVIISVNDLVVKMSKYDKREIIGNTHQIFNSKFHTDGFFKNMWQTISQGKVWHGLIKNKAKDGSYFWIKNTITPLVGDDGKIQQYIAIWTDITKQRRNEDTLSITLKALKNAEKLKDEFATMVSHELKTPLTPIKFNTEMLLEDNVLGTLNQDQRESVEDIEINAIRLEKLIGDILSAQKLDMKKMVFNKNKFNTDDYSKM